MGFEGDGGCLLPGPMKRETEVKPVQPVKPWEGVRPVSKRIFFYTGSFTHTLYKQQFSHPPAGTVYIPSSTELLAPQAIRQDFRTRDRWWFRPVVQAKHAALSVPKRLGMVNLRRLNRPDCDLIHSAQYLLLSKNRWVIDFEDASVFTWYSRAGQSRPWARRMVRRRLEDPRCRWILPWTNAARLSLLNAFDCFHLAHKIKVVHPAIDPKPLPEADRLGRRACNVLFVGTIFYEKGGWETLLACERVARHQNLHLTMVTYAPRDVLASYAARKFVSFRKNVSQQELDSLYRSADVFVYPAHTDTFGFVLLEAMSYGIACIGSRHFAIPEILDEDKSGLLVEVEVSRFGPDGVPRYEPITGPKHPMMALLRQPSETLVESLVAAIARLAENVDLRTQLARSGYEETLDGRFSFRHRNQLLSECYLNALEEG